MSKIFLSIAAFVVLGLFSCQKDTEITPNFQVVQPTEQSDLFNNWSFKSQGENVSVSIFLPFSQMADARSSIQILASGRVVETYFNNNYSNQCPSGSNNCGSCGGCGSSSHSDSIIEGTWKKEKNSVGQDVLTMTFANNQIVKWTVVELKKNELKVIVE